ncbi:MAG: phosphoribosyl-ATP diphosphatase [DPANN group archaeon]|nr:phosphoribosyl-ATP diphosphatase [DPANN group archaeon]
MDNILDKVFEIIEQRKLNKPEGSYVSGLMTDDKKTAEDKILEKIGEESTEVIIASKNNIKEEIIYESTDLLFHLMVLLSYKNISFKDIENELKRRYK